MSQESPEVLLGRFTDLILRTETLEDVFCGFVIVSKENEDLKNSRYEEEMTNLIKALGSQENIEVAFREYVNFTASIASESKIMTMLSLLEYAVKNNLLSAKLVCELILMSDKLHYENEAFWCCSFDLIDKIIAAADYKGVRDLVKIMLDKVNSIPASANVAILSQLKAMFKVFEHVFDRNACLLPAYLVLDEIQKKMYPKGRWPHWKFAKLLSSFVDSFRPIAQMVSIAGRSKLLPIVNYSSTIGNTWKLDPSNYTFQTRCLLPYNKELMEPQTYLLRYVLEQPYSKDMVCTMLGLNSKQKQRCPTLEEQRCPILEEQMVELILTAMERSEIDSEGGDVSEQAVNQMLFFWQHLSSLVIYFVLFHHASFPHMVLNLHDKLAAKNLRKGRDHLMWVLLQFISGSIQKNSLVDFLPIMKLHDLLYPEKEPLPVPDITKPSCTHAMAISSIWIHLMKKAELEPVKLQRPLPVSLKLHVEFLQQNLMNTSNLQSSFSTDFRISLLCNAYSTNQECFTRPMGVLVEAVQGNRSNNNSNSSNGVQSSPLSMSILDSLTVHTKMSLIHNIVTQMVKMAQSKSPALVSPALIETYSRLLIYTEIESLGIKGFMTQLLNTVWRSQAWSMLHTVLEMFVYRLHHVPAHYRIQLLGHLHSLSSVSQTNHTQLHLCIESTALRLILGLSGNEVLSIHQFSRFQNEPKGLISTESEELNKILVLTLARGILMTGSETLSVTWCDEFLANIMQNTQLTWSSYTLACFPPPIAKYYNQYSSINKENKAQLKRSVDEEYRKWITMSNENDIIAHFSLQGTPPLFLCLLWKMLLENDRINPIAYKILDRIGARALSVHLRTLADYLVYEFANSFGGQHVSKCIDALNDLIWKCHVITLDRLLLCLALRSFEGNEAQVCLFIIQMLLLKPSEFKNRVYDFVQENSPEHWKQSNWHEKHLAFLRKYPEKFYFEHFQEMSSQSIQHTYFSVYFSNVCLRFIPVFDIIIHRFLELTSMSMSVDSLLDQLGCLYKFHDRPITYLYNTLHYYEQKLRDRPQLKRKLVASIIGSLKDIKPKNWALTDAYMGYIQRNPEDTDWTPDLDYYIKLVGRIVDTMNSKSPFPHIDYRFNEFTNAGVHALHVTCVELMALPVSASVVGNNLLEVILTGHKVISRSNIESWVNAVGLVLTALPESYLSVLNDRILNMMQSPVLLNCEKQDPFHLLDFNGSHSCMTEMQIGYLIALTSSVYHHSSVGQISLLPQFLKERVKPAIKTEEQFLFICHIVGPFLQRLYVERTRIVMDVTIELYEMLEVVDKSSESLRYIDPICDLLYHIKYRFTGDSIKSEIERIVRNLRPQLQMRLRFLTRMNIETS